MLTVAVAVGIWAPLHLLNAAETKAGQQLMWTPKVSPDKAPAPAPACPIVAMSCPKCKNVPSKEVTMEKGHIQKVTVYEKHLCNACSTTSKTVGTGKAVKTVFQHTCADAMASSASCCN